MLEVSDVDLMRLADGTLAEPRLSAVEAEVSVRPELQQQLEAYLATGKALAQLFVPIAEAPVPERLLNTIHSAPAAAPRTLHRAQARSARVTSHGRGWLAALLQPDWRLSPMAAAAALTCVAAIGAAIMLTEPRNSFVGTAPEALAAALEKEPTQPKGANIDWPGSSGARIVVDLSFKHKDGRFCRQYYLGLDSDTRAYVGFACSDGNGNWRVEKDGVLPVRTASKLGDYRPSEEGPTVAAVEEAVSNAMVGDALEPARERALIQQGWPREKQ
jgi:hypothetical protein